MYMFSSQQMLHENEVVTYSIRLKYYQLLHNSQFLFFLRAATGTTNCVHSTMHSAPRTLGSYWIRLTHKYVRTTYLTHKLASRCLFKDLLG
jgi:hypothetical protein